MRSPIWTILLLAAGGSAQLTTVTECEAYSYTGTSTFTEYTTYYTTADGIGGARPPTTTSLRTSLTSFTLPFASTSTGDSYTDGGVGGSRSTTRSTLSTTTSFTSSVIGNGTSLLIPGDDEPVTPNTPIPTSVTTTSRTSTLTSTLSTSGSSTSASSDATSSISSISSTTDSSSTTADSTTSNADTSSTTTDSASTTDSTTSTSTTTTITTPVASSTTSSLVPLVTDQAYIDTVLRHHNRHRLNHTAPDLTWDPALAATAKKIADGCVYAHDTKTDCPTYDTESCHGQNIGAGYLPVQMGYLISDGFYNSEVNYYTYYGGEPDTSTLHEWGHFSQIVWVDTGSVGCYTSDCTKTGLGNIAASTGIRPFFTVCNYAPPGNYIDEFADNVLSPIPLDTIHAGYQCPTDENCVDGSV